MDVAERTARVVHYRNKSEEVRVIAESMTDSEARRILMIVAMDYFMLAENLERTVMPDPIPASE